MATTPQALIGEIDRLADRPQEIMNRGHWFPMAAFGLLSIIAGVIFTSWDPNTTSSWLVFAIGAPIAALATMAWFSALGERSGVRPTNPWKYPVLALVCFMGCGAVGVFVSEQWVLAGILVVVGFCQIGFALLDKYSPLVMTGVGLGFLGVALGIGEASSATSALLVGGFLLAAAVSEAVSS